MLNFHVTGLEGLPSYIDVAINEILKRYLRLWNVIPKLRNISAHLKCLSKPRADRIMLRRG